MFPTHTPFEESKAPRMRWHLTGLYFTDEWALCFIRVETNKCPPLFNAKATQEACYAECVCVCVCVALDEMQNPLRPESLVSMPHCLVFGRSGFLTAVNNL